MRFTCCHKNFLVFHKIFICLLNNTSLRHTDIGEYCSHSWADWFDCTTHNSDKYLKQSIKIMLSNSLWKWKHDYYHIYDNADYIVLLFAKFRKIFENIIYGQKCIFKIWQVFFWHLIWLNCKDTWQIASEQLSNANFEWLAIMEYFKCNKSSFCYSQKLLHRIWK